MRRGREVDSRPGADRLMAGSSFQIQRFKPIQYRKVTAPNPAAISDTFGPGLP